jgi:CheY-like chemotaxis protein
LTPKKKILVVDDEESIRTVLEFTLAQAGYEADTAANGDECLEKVYAFEPDLILLDIMMPQVDGWEVMRLLRANPETEKIPIVLLTAKGEIRDKLAALQQGATDYVTKPFAKADLLQRLGEILA